MSSGFELAKSNRISWALSLSIDRMAAYGRRLELNLPRAVRVATRRAPSLSKLSSTNLPLTVRIRRLPLIVGDAAQDVAIDSLPSNAISVGERFEPRPILCRRALFSHSRRIFEPNLKFHTVDKSNAEFASVKKISTGVLIFATRALAFAH
jgi:hypothetical protein